MICESCRTKEVERDGFCSWHGPFNDRIICDDCVFEERGRGNTNAAVKRPMSQADLEHAIASIEAAQKNLATIDGFLGRDPAGANRNADVVLGFRQARPVYEALLGVLRGMRA